MYIIQEGGADTTLAVSLMKEGADTISVFTWGIDIFRGFVGEGTCRFSIKFEAKNASKYMRVGNLSNQLLYGLTFTTML